MKLRLTDFNDFEVVSVEMEGLDNLLVELQVARVKDNFLEVLND